MAHVVGIVLEPGTPKLGLWCNLCALPSAIEVPLLQLTMSGVSRTGTWRGCTSHGAGNVDKHRGE